jgi:Holliday junction DNA helicase RuvA
MIVSLRGDVIERHADLDKASAEIVIEVSGVGYRLVVTPRTLASLPSSGEAKLHVHHHFWEADQKLYGFESKDERIAFEGLLAAHKVGPALALAIIATHAPEQLARILDNDDLDALCEVPGVGKKTAQRLLVELKSTLVLPVLEGSGGAIAAVDAVTVGPEADVRQALRELGYSSDEIKSAMASLPAAVDGDGVDSGALLKLALRSLAAG